MVRLILTLPTYRFNGMEDIHIDGRIVQFLTIANPMISGYKAGGTGRYDARNYSVVPLGPHSGLIQVFHRCYLLHHYWFQYIPHQAESDIKRYEPDMSQYTTISINTSPIFTDPKPCITTKLSQI